MVMRERQGRPLLLIDIAVPRDIEAACGELEGVSLYDIDDLQAVVARNLNTRASEAPRAQEIVEEEIHRFARWLGQLDTLPTVSALREHGNDLVEQVLAENAGRWESASPRDLARIEAVARAVMSRLLHEPTIQTCARPTSPRARPPAGSSGAVRAANGRTRRRSSRRLSWPRFTTCAAVASADADRNPCERAGAGTGRDGGPGCWERRDRPGRDRRNRGVAGEDKSRWVAELEQALLRGEIPISPCTRPRTCRASSRRAWRCWAHPSARR